MRGKWGVDCAMDCAIERAGLTGPRTEDAISPQSQVRAVPRARKFSVRD